MPHTRFRSRGSGRARSFSSSASPAIGFRKSDPENRAQTLEL